MRISNKNLLFLIELLEQSIKIPRTHNYIFKSSLEAREKILQEIIKELVASLPDEGAKNASE